MGVPLHISFLNKFSLSVIQLKLFRLWLLLLNNWHVVIIPEHKPSHYEIVPDCSLDTCCLFIYLISPVSATCPLLVHIIHDSCPQVKQIHSVSGRLSWKFLLPFALSDPCFFSIKPKQVSSNRLIVSSHYCL